MSGSLNVTRRRPARARHAAATLPSLCARSAQVQLAALDLRGEVLQVLAHLALWVGDGIRHHLTDPTTGRVSVVHGDVYARAALRNLLETHLPGGLDVVVVCAVPGNAALRAHLGGPGVELDRLAQRPFDPPMARIASHADLLDVAHDLREVLQVRPVREHLLQRRLYFDALLYALGHSLPFSSLRYLVCTALHTRTRAPLIPVRPRDPVYNSPGGAENGVIQDRQEHLRTMLLPRGLVNPGEWQPARPPRSPGQYTQGRAHTRLLYGLPVFSAQKTQSSTGPDTVSQVCNRCQYPPGLGREAVQHPELLQPLDHLLRCGRPHQPEPGHNLAEPGQRQRAASTTQSSVEGPPRRSHALPYPGAGDITLPATSRRRAPAGYPPRRSPP